ncbi:MAG: hypothetical protein DI586_01200 [Micavibrio aeruginosavorus]|uniref:Uncharacterized protein n=1 Tax=Micavibrio aeruginosavorus TaxID=349221 RepID=A0A2W5FMH2_9BACT|nr:MAG: hypothetical protein DI586_01200 [Micavibrio aeruginosavorus]
MLSVNSSFQCNDRGAVGISFDDPNFVRAETIIYEEATGNVHALLNNKQMLIGHISGTMTKAFSNQNSVTLSSQRIDGTVLDLEARLVVVH